MGLMLIIIDVFHIIFDSVSREKSALPLTIEGTSKTLLDMCLMVIVMPGKKNPCQNILQWEW